jgi:hypothetical protein
MILLIVTFTALILIAAHEVRRRRLRRASVAAQGVAEGA